MSDDLSDHQWHLISLTGDGVKAGLYVGGRFQATVFGTAVTSGMLIGRVGNPFDDEVDDV